MNTTNHFYLGLEQSLHVLRIHFDMSRGATNEEVLGWAKYFEDWSRKAFQHCGPWSAENLKHAEDFVKNLEKPKAGMVGYEVLEKAMGEAAVSLNSEILGALQQTPGPKEPIPA